MVCQALRSDIMSVRSVYWFRRAMLVYGWIGGVGISADKEALTAISVDAEPLNTNRSAGILTKIKSAKTQQRRRTTPTNQSTKTLTQKNKFKQLWGGVPRFKPKSKATQPISKFKEPATSRPRKNRQLAVGCCCWFIVVCDCVVSNRFKLIWNAHGSDNSKLV